MEVEVGAGAGAVQLAAFPRPQQTGRTLGQARIHVAEVACVVVGVPYPSQTVAAGAQREEDDAQRVALGATEALARAVDHAHQGEEGNRVEAGAGTRESLPEFLLS